MTSNRPIRVDPTSALLRMMVCALLVLSGPLARAIGSSNTIQGDSADLPLEVIRPDQPTPRPGRHGNVAAETLAAIEHSDHALFARRLAEAKTLAQQAIETARASDDSPLLAAAFNQLGNVHLSLGEHAQALRCYDQALAAGGIVDEHPTRLPIQINRVHAYLGQHKFAAARTAHQRALAIALRAAPTTGPSDHLTDRLIALGHLAQRLVALRPDDRAALIQPAYQAFSKALAIANAQSDTTGKSYATGHLGELYAGERRFAEAQRLLRQAIFFAEEADAPDLLARWWWQLGRAYKAQQQIDEALAAYQRAVAELRPIQPMLVAGERGYPAAFWSITRQIYLEYASLLLDDTNPSARRDEQVRLREVRHAMEDFKAVELENHFRDYCVTEQRARNRALHIDALLPPGTATLYPVLFDDRLVVLLGLPTGQIEHAVIRVGAEEVRDTARRFRSSMSPSSNPRRLRKQARQLYDWLIAPFREQIATSSIHTLIAVPDGILRTIPFAALHDGKDYLVQHLAIAVSPGLLLTERLHDVDRQHRLLAAGLSESVQGFEGLPHVDAEIAKITAEYNGKQLLNEDFVKRSIVEELAEVPYSMVSLSTHGRFDSDPSKSFVLTYDGQLSFDELADLIRVSELRTQAVELIVLSACNTAIGDEHAALGFAGVAVKSGARSAMASLWSVNDESTAELVPDFLSKLSDPRLSKAQALQLAQRRLLSEQRTAHPYFWAPFVLVGNWL